ncbi:MAG: NAD/NADP octopine/nopaline dehydrogenase family protein, partial [Alphaproteobacteria bacterium]|nr:NAD/NADP octopine/nopaline dehydrogenase family protein [Alphaproteobacteria bacterium]
MPIVKIQIEAIERFSGGRSFGDAGSYLRIKGIAKGEIDPAAPQNSVIADLGKAPRNARGMIEYETDFFILRPAELRRANSVLVYDVTNRGRKMILNLLDDALGNADTNNPKTAQDVGLGFTLGCGYSLVWSGWDSGTPRANNGMTARLPPALENGEPMVRCIRDEFHIGTRAPGKGDVVRLNYPAISTDQRKARLTVRDRESDDRTEIPPECWEFVDRQSIRLLPVGTHFAPYKIYDLWYDATGSTVLGAGFAATRDLISFLRYERADCHGMPNSMLGSGRRDDPPEVEHALAFGVSQAGRFLRHFLELGMNDDGHGRRVFDGVLTHVAGAGIGGVYLISELGIAGFKLRLHDTDHSRLSEIRARGGVDVEGEKDGFAAVERTTSDLKSAVDGADVIIIVTGGNTQWVVARSLAPLLRDGQVVLLIQGNTGGSLIVRRALDDAGCRADVDVAEMDNYPYSCWRLSPTRIRPIVRKRWLQIATFPGNRISVVFPRLSPLFPEAIAAPNVLYTGFTNANAMLHVANCVANVGRIETGEAYKFYAEGVTPAVARLYEAINAERVAVAAALGASVPSLADWFDRVYGVREATLVETCQRLTYN